MAANTTMPNKVSEKIIDKISLKTTGRPNKREFLEKLLQYELEGHGWFKDDYMKMLENATEGENGNAL